jgi:FkbM family methyltransferase
MSLSKNIAAFENWVTFYAARYGLVRKEFTLKLRHGVRLIVRPQTEDLTIVKSVFVKRHYIRDFISLTAESTVLDVGAHIGAFTVLAARRVKRTLAFEPEKNNFELLKRNISLNNLQNATVFNMAVSGSSGVKAFHICEPDATGGHSLFRPSRNHTLTVDVKTSSIVDIMSEHNLPCIDLLKLDCEGAEHEIIDSLTPEISSKLKNIVMETHGLENRSPKHLAERLVHLGFEVRTEKNGGYIYARRT